MTYYVSIPCYVSDIGKPEMARTPDRHLHVTVWAYDSRDAIERVCRAIEAAVTEEHIKNVT